MRVYSTTASQGPINTQTGRCFSGQALKHPGSNLALPSRNVWREVCCSRHPYVTACNRRVRDSHHIKKLEKVANPLAPESATADGEIRHAQGCSAPLLGNESRTLALTLTWTDPMRVFTEVALRPPSQNGLRSPVGHFRGHSVPNHSNSVRAMHHSILRGEIFLR